MKIILSRKGFDASAGGMPSPILPDGRMVSLPIPSRTDRRRLSDIRFEDVPLGRLVEQLSGGRTQARQTVHMDPDIYADFIDRPRGWRAALGQTGAAQAHLANQGVRAGDLFLFYGWFRQTLATPDGPRFDRQAPDLHVIYGWLQVGEVWPVVSNRQALLHAHPALADHPHVARPDHYSNPRNTLYLASEGLSLPGLDGTRPGCGTFRRFDPGLCLTEPGQSRRIWRLPSWFHPGRKRPPLSFHRDPARWSRHGRHVRLESAARGQEFVLDAAFYSEARRWAGDLIARAPTSSP